MRRFRLYLESSFWMRLEDKRDHLRRTLSYDFLNSSSYRHEILLSGLVLDEIAEGPAGERRKLRRQIERVRARVLPGAAWAGRFAEELMSLGPFGQSRVDDLKHVGYAVGGKVDALVTWDVKTLACDPVRRACALACRRTGRRAPFLGTPLEVARWLGLQIPPGSGS